MKRTTTLFLALSAAAALAQQPTPKTSEQQARTYIASAFLTGAAPPRGAGGRARGRGPAPARALEATPPGEPAKPALKVVEPQEPRMGKQAPAAAPTAQAVTAPLESPRPLLKPTGPCEIKPVMSDQDLVNCGATPR